MGGPVHRRLFSATGVAVRAEHHLWKMKTYKNDLEPGAAGKPSRAETQAQLWGGGKLAS